MAETTEVTDMHQASRSLIAGAKIIIDSDGIRDRGAVRMPTLPVTVCCALAIEIALKALLKLEGAPFPRESGGHSLKALFEALASSTQEELLALQTNFTGRTTDDARAQLNLEDLTFVKWRYAYEHEHLSTDAAFLHDFAVALSEHLRSKITR
jgi:hypothetical protein